MIVFVTSDNGKMEEFAELTRESKSMYCEEHGYQFYHVSFDPNVNPYWEQVRVMMEAFDCCEDVEWINYTGADSYIVRDAEDCEYLLDEDYDLLISKDENGLNNNGFFLKNSEWGREFLRRVWAMKSDSTIPVRDNGDGLVALRPNGWSHDWYEQSAFIIVLREMGLERVKFLDKSIINAYPSDPGFDPKFIVHLPGISNEDRIKYIQEHCG